MFAILVSSFVIACCLTTLTAMVLVLRSERQRKADSEIILAAEPLRPEWIYGRRMDVPRKHPLMRTRNAKSLR